ncbi:MAG: FG-nucleoporin nsp1 [Trizodia sp. TS-e1964]|nr:MAG: FG-nucleoporin nsp1 [Trizodia sp. TS-e1964]
MSEAPKQSMFGAPATSNAGSAMAKPASTGPFASTQPTSSLFGNSSTPSATTQPQSLFGGLKGSTTFGGGFSGGATAGSSSAPTTSASGNSFSFASKTPGFDFKTINSSSSQPAASSPIFSTPNKPNPPLFPAQPATASQHGAENRLGSLGGFKLNSTPPSSNPTSSLLFSTTPAGPPPPSGTNSSTNAAIGSNQSNLFSSVGQNQDRRQLPLGQQLQKPQSNLFGSAVSSSVLADNASAVSSSSASNNTFSKGNPQANSPFASFNPPKPTSSPAVSQAISTTAPGQPSFNLFGGLKGSSSTPSSSGPGSSSPGTSGPSSNPFALNVPSSNSSAPRSILSSAPETQPPNISNILPSITGASSTAQPPASTSAGSLFGTQQTTASAPSLFSAKSAPAPGALGSLFSSKPPTSGVLGTASTSSANHLGSQAPSTSASSILGKPAPKPADPKAPPADPPALGKSTQGPAPNAQSRLKNKSMDEIITRWASDLAKYQKEFQTQAEKISQWDRLLIKNGEKIQKLHSSTFEAERASSEVERQLANVEGEQSELEAWLDKYEHEVNEMFSKQVSGAEGIQGPDQERDRMYKLAQDLSERLESMGKDLTSMIDDINSASSTLSKTTKSDDPLSKIVKVLNSHLSQLQWIDQNASQLQVKVAAAQKAKQNITEREFGERGVVGDFYRSVMGKR